MGTVLLKSEKVEKNGTVPFSTRGAAEILYRSELGDKDKVAARVKNYEGRFANPFVAAERGFLDEIIMPHSTRKRIARALDMLRHKELKNPWKKHDNIPL